MNDYRIIRHPTIRSMYRASNGGFSVEIDMGERFGPPDYSDMKHEDCIVTVTRLIDKQQVRHTLWANKFKKRDFTYEKRGSGFLLFSKYIWFRQDKYALFNYIFHKAPLWFKHQDE